MCDFVIGLPCLTNILENLRGRILIFVAISFYFLLNKEKVSMLQLQIEICKEIFFYLKKKLQITLLTFGVYEFYTIKLGGCLNFTFNVRMTILSHPLDLSLPTSPHMGFPHCTKVMGQDFSPTSWGGTRIGLDILDPTRPIPVPHPLIRVKL